ncbi:hypothetical protein QOT17_011003 [Balamuthia mandrillaris]
MEVEKPDGLEDLPPELLCLIFEFIPTQELLPVLLLSSKCLSAASDEQSWLQRCRDDLNLCYKIDPESSWKQNYQSSSSPSSSPPSSLVSLLILLNNFKNAVGVMDWDPSQATLPQPQLSVLCKQLNVTSIACASQVSKETFFFPRKGVVEWDDRLVLSKNHQIFAVCPFLHLIFAVFLVSLSFLLSSLHSGYVSVRGNRCFTTGIHAVEFVILKRNRSIWSVGFIDDDFDCRIRAFWRADGTRPSTTCYSWGNTTSASHSVTGSPTAYSRIRAVPFGWKEGDRLGALVDMNVGRIHYFLNDKHVETLPLEPKSKRLWPVATLLDKGCSVELRRSSPSVYLPKLEQAIVNRCPSVLP